MKYFKISFLLTLFLSMGKFVFSLERVSEEESFWVEKQEFVKESFQEEETLDQEGVFEEEGLSEVDIYSESYIKEPFGGVQIHGFVTQGYQKSSANNFYAPTSCGTFAIGEVGIVFKKQLSKCMDVGIQLLGQKLGELRDFSMKVDWAFGNIKLCPTFNLRIGKVKVPMGFWNEIRDVEPARTFIVLPQGFYQELFRPYFIAILGGGVYGEIPLDCWGKVDYEALYGNNDVDASHALIQNVYFQVERATRTVNISERTCSRSFLALFANWHTPFKGLDIAFSYDRAKADIRSIFNSPLGPGQGSMEMENLLLEFWAISCQYTCDRWIFTGEAARRKIFFDQVIQLGPLGPTSLRKNRRIAEDYHIAVEYDACEWLTIGTYYDVFIRDRKLRNQPRFYLKDLALALRFDINDYWMIKLEGHRFLGHAPLIEENNLESFHDRWWLGAAKVVFVF